MYLYPFISSYPLEKWMNFLHDDADEELISKLSIPGTHNSYAITNSWFGFGRTQIAPIDWQLAHGVRYLDIRCAIDPYGGDYFKIYHGSTYQGFTFGEVITQCLDFLDKHPTETILMRVQQEWTRDEDRYRRIFTTYLEEGVGAGRFWLGNWIPTLREVRGKIVLLTGNPYINRGLHFYDMQIQDDYENPQIAAKQTAIADCIDASVYGSGNTLYINHLSATGAGHSLWTPWDYAEVMNRFTLNLIMHNYRKKTQLGVIIKDYDLGGVSASHQLTVAVVECNRFK